MRHFSQSTAELLDNSTLPNPLRGFRTQTAHSFSKSPPHANVTFRTQLQNYSIIVLFQTSMDSGHKQRTLSQNHLLECHFSQSTAELLDNSTLPNPLCGFRTQTTHSFPKSPPQVSLFVVNRRIT